MSGPNELLTAGIDAAKQKDFEKAEDLLLAAYSRCALTDDGRRTACIYLGEIYRKTGRSEDAIRMLERGLPFPAAFKELVKLYRGFAKEMKKTGNLTNCAEWYRRMFCLSTIYAGVMTLRVPNVPVAVDWGRAAKWLDDIRRQCGTLYAHQWDGREVPDDTLLSATDYKALRETIQGAG